uniref:Si:ch211-241f5.3 n=1 Tax=Pygocentrus nattereri TaxID=42514 RepID=A0A3B4CCP1_PYGNA
GKMSHFQCLFYVLCYIVSKILGCEMCKSLHSVIYIHLHFIQCPNFSGMAVAYRESFDMHSTSFKTDEDECEYKEDYCGKNACSNTPGSYFCTCKDGFVLSNGEKKFNASQGVTCDGKTRWYQTRFLKALDAILSAGPLNRNKKVTTVLETTENVLKLLGPLLSNISKSNDDTAAMAWKVFFDHIRKQENETLKINSKVVTAVVTNPNTTQLKKQIILTFSHLQPSDGNQMYVFWDSFLDGGAWCTKGCTVVCSCTHLSSFAVLMTCHEMQEVFELQLVAWVGLSLSLICLLICILTFGFICSIQSTRTTIHLHLCINLFIANLVFLAGIRRMENKLGCAFVAGLLHVFFLVALCWMCLEGVQLFNMVVLVFNTMLRPLYLMLGGYGVPVLIVIISASINARGYGTKHHCWPNLKGGFTWMFFSPVCVIIGVNVFFFLITIWKLVQKISLLKQDLITAIAQLCVLGTMWIFSCFQFERGSLVMSYLFTICLSLQRVLVFVMHCLLSKQVSPLISFRTTDIQSFGPQLICLTET